MPCPIQTLRRNISAPRSGDGLSDIKDFVDKGVVHKVLDNEGVQSMLCAMTIAHIPNTTTSTRTLKCLRCGHTGVYLRYQYSGSGAAKGYQAGNLTC